MRVYLSNIKHTNDDVFMEHAENNGDVYSLKGFQKAWNDGSLGNYKFILIK